ncbi:MAG TPA: 30S ribosomal protein THX [Bacteroidetes bacterium]|nr:30S ribosomal protein THX [Bacteroidota bacterium]
MGKGDGRSRRSKIWRGTHGKTRPRKKRKNRAHRRKPKPQTVG